jgi:Excalibur calcium-binding domain
VKGLAVFAAVLLFAPATPALAATEDSSESAASAAIPKPYKNCTALNKKYPHGLGRAKARDKTSGTPVTNFKRSTKLYKIALSHNGRLDGDKDGIACEKA